MHNFLINFYNYYNKVRVYKARVYNLDGWFEVNDFNPFHALRGGKLHSATIKYSAY